MTDPRAEGFIIALDQLEATLTQVPRVKKVIKEQNVRFTRLSLTNILESFIKDVQPFLEKRLTSEAMLSLAKKYCVSEGHIQHATSKVRSLAVNADAEGEKRTSTLRDIRTHPEYRARFMELTQQTTREGREAREQIAQEFGIVDQERVRAAMSSLEQKGVGIPTTQTRINTNPTTGWQLRLWLRRKKAPRRQSTRRSGSGSG